MLMAILLSSPKLFAQEDADEKAGWDIRFSGFINAQVFFDSRKIVESRAGMVSLYPAPAAYDAGGRDLNARAGFNQAAMTTRLRGTINGPGALGASLSAVIETDFTGSSNADNNGLRLREGWVQLKWPKASLLIGQYWHPLYLPESRPNTIGLNLGAPFHPFARHNQLRFTWKTGDIRLVAVAASQRDYASDGPAGRSPKYQHHAVIPNMHLQLQWKPGEHLFGFGADYKIIQPRLAVEMPGREALRTNEKVQSFAATAFLKLDYTRLSIKWQAVAGQNLTEFIMLGGYVEKKVDSLQQLITYTPTAQLSAWTDIATKGKSFRLGLLGGYAANLGYSGPAQGMYYGLGREVAWLYRISPRAEWHAGRLMIALELEYTAAAYGTPDKNGLVRDIYVKGNLRSLLAAFLFF